jgi:hypothetical protein
VDREIAAFFASGAGIGIAFGLSASALPMPHGETPQGRLEVVFFNGRASFIL